LLPQAPRATTAPVLGAVGKGNLTRLYDEVASTLPTAVR
jgi:hypothetical protein